MPLPFAGPDRLLAHFQRTGDARALGALFDRAAPELLRVACWLAGNRADAEDLLQRTFLTVLTAPGGYDPARRALPWLCGVLGNHARKLHEQRARPPLVALPAAAPDPVAAAAAAELAATVARLRDAIGAPYAEVLDLHLAAGLDAKQIAARLGRPAGTVRTQLVRALRRLRELLPAGFATGAAVLSAPAQAAVLTSVRAAVLRAAASAAVGHASAAVLGSSLMTKKLLAFVPLVLLLGSAVWLGLRPDAASPPDPTAAMHTDARRAATAAPQPPDATAAAASANAAARTELAAAPSPAVEPGLATLVVRATWSDDRTPAAELGLRLQPDPGRGALERERATGADGVARFPRVVPGRYELCSGFSAPRPVDLAGGAAVEIELVADRTQILEGSVVDAAGRAVANARLWLGEGTPPRGFEVGRSDADGRFRIARGRCDWLGARMAGFAPSRLWSVPTAQPIVLRLATTGGTVRGRVVDVDGRPVGDAALALGQQHIVTTNTSAGDRQAVAFGARLVSDAAGAFVHEGCAAGPTRIVAWAAGHAPTAIDVVVPAGGVVETTLVLPRAAAVAGVVRDAARQPVAGARVVVHVHEALGTTFTLTTADGSYRLDDVAVGKLDLHATLGGARAYERVQVSAGQVARWDPVLQGARQLRGRLVGANGAALAALQVGLLTGSAPWPQTTVTTGDDGTFALDGVDGPTVELMVLRDEQPLATRRVSVDTEPVVVTLTDDERPTARIRGRVVDPNGEPLNGSVAITGAAFAFGRGVPVENGAFCSDLLPAGWFVVMVNASRGRLELDPVHVRAGEELVLPDVVLAPTGRVELAITGITPAPGQRVTFVRTGGRATSQVSMVVMLEGASARVELAPGEYAAIAALPEAGAAGAVAVLVRSGETTRATLACAPARPVQIEARFVEAPPVGPLSVLVHDDAGALVDFGSIGLRGDASAKARWTTRLAPGNYRVSARTVDGRSGDTTLAVTAGDAPLQAVIDVRER